MKAVALIVAILLTACAGQKPEPVIETHDVNLPVATSCVPDTLPPSAVYPDSASALTAAPDFAARYDLMAKGWVPRNERLSLLESIVAICRKVQPPKEKVVQ